LTDRRRALARPAWRTVSTRQVYANPWIRLREDVAELPDGRTTLYGVVECKPCVAVLPFPDARTAVMIGQDRYVARAFSWEMPTGAMRPGEREEEAVQRELAEEAGDEGERLRQTRCLRQCEERDGGDGPHLPRRRTAPGGPRGRPDGVHRGTHLRLRRGAADGGDLRDRRRHDGGRRAARRPAPLRWARGSFARSCARCSRCSTGEWTWSVSSTSPPPGPCSSPLTIRTIWWTR